MSLAHFPVAEIDYDERDYDTWLATLTQASERLDTLQTVVNELRQLCSRTESVDSRQILEVLQKHHAVT
jgi:hypothetical protein